MAGETAGCAERTQQFHQPSIVYSEKVNHMSIRKSSIVRLLPLILCLFLFSACNLFGTPRQPVKAPANKQIYNIPEIGITDFDTLDPALAHNNATTNTVQMLFTGLVQLDNHLQAHAQLAQSWQVGTDGVTWTFHLKPRLKFSDGTPLTSADVAYSINRALEPATQSTVAPIYLGVLKDADQFIAGRIPTLINDSILTPDANTVILITSKKVPYFLAMLAAPCSYVIEKSLVSKYGPNFSDHLTEGGGAGPFKVASYTHHVALNLVPNPNYYNAPPQLQKVNLLFYPSASQAYQDYQSGKVDMAEIPPADMDSNKTRPDFVQVPWDWINYYTMNYLVKPFDNVHIRQAFALAIDKTAIARNVWKNSVIPTNHIVPQGINDYNPRLTSPDDTPGLTGDATKAQALLKQGMQEEGWPSIAQIPPITLTYASTVAGTDQEVADLIQDWKNVLQITVTANAVDSSTLLDRVVASTNNPNGLQMWGLTWTGEYADPHDWLTEQFGQGAIYNNMNYGQNSSSAASQQQAIQQMLGTADSSMDENAHLQDYQQAEQQLVNDVAWLPIEQATTTFLRTPNIVGIVDNAQEIIPPDDWAHIYRVE
jgi:peptide/nickel transport system substrate-binding protein/oligopeptide transport system substrate-binding protein